LNEGFGDINIELTKDGKIWNDQGKINVIEQNNLSGS